MGFFFIFFPFFRFFFVLCPCFYIILVCIALRYLLSYSSCLHFWDTQNFINTDLLCFPWPLENRVKLCFIDEPTKIC